MDDYDRILLAIRIGQTVSVRYEENDAVRATHLKAQVIPESLTRVDLGLEVQDISTRYRRRLGAGVVVRDVRPDGVFANITPPPIIPGDILVSINGSRMESVEVYEAVARRLKKGMKAEFVVRRQNILYTFTVQL